MYGLFSDPMTITNDLDQIGGFLPGGAIDVARDQLTRVASKGSQPLGWTFLIGLTASLWSANAAMKALFDTLNIVHGEEDKRGFVRLNAISLGFTLGGVAFILAAVALRYVERRTLFCGSRDGPRSRPYLRTRGDLPLRAQPGDSAVAVDHLGQRHRSASLDRGVGTVLMVCRQFRQVQRNVRFAWGDYRLHDLALAFGHNRASGRRDRR